MKLHLLGLPHTITRDEFSHCAFTGKVQRFSPMMRSVGYHVTHYGVAGATSGADEQVDVLTHEEWQLLCAKTRADFGHAPPTDASFVGDLANTDGALFRAFNFRLAALLQERVAPRDVICLPFGHAHAGAVAGLSNAKVETGIGYPITCTNRRVFESYTWQSYHLGKDGENDVDYSWVIPNYYDLTEWPVGNGHGRYALFFGRIGERKGLNVIREMAARRPDVRFVICGQGDPTPWLTLPNIEAHPPVHGRARSKLVREAAVMLAPTRFVEPFCGSVVEAALSGTPAITSDHGAFSETVVDEITGFRCKTLGDYLAALDRVMAGELSRDAVAARARAKYDMFALASAYDRVFRQVDDLNGVGWYSERSHLAHGRREEAA